MNRIIKFRAFDDGKMIYEKDIKHILLENDEVLKLARFLCNIRNDSKLMQYTGFKDKNGKEIYEGDILMINDYRKGIYITGKQPLKKQVMVYSNGFHGADFGGEIIGNIYENPELLKP